MDPVDIYSVDKKEEKREFGYYEIISIIQNKTYFSYSDINKVLDVNKISKNKLIKAVEDNYLIIYSIANQILSQSMVYKESKTEIEQEVELTKSFPYKINVTNLNIKESDNENEKLEKYEKGLVVYKEKE